MEDMQDMQEVSAQSGEESGKKKSGFFQRLFRGLTKTRDNIVTKHGLCVPRVYQYR